MVIVTFTPPSIKLSKKERDKYIKDKKDEGYVCWLDTLLNHMCMYDLIVLILIHIICSFV